MESETVLWVSQIELDEEISEEILEMLLTQLTNCVCHFTSNVLYTIKPEVTALLRQL